MQKSKLSILLPLIISSSYALDYGDEASDLGTKKLPAQATSSKTIKSSSSQSSSNQYDVALKYSSIKKVMTTSEEAFQAVKLDLHVDTGRNFYLNLADGIYSNADSTKDKKKYQGNPQLTVGLNWLQVGNTRDQTTLSNQITYSHGINNSIFASSRNDAGIGLVLSKRMDDLVVGISYDYTMTGKAKNSNELKIGNIQKFTLGLGLQISNDIKLSLEGVNYQIASAKSTEGNYLNQSDVVSFITPKLILNLNPNTEWDLGASFLSQKAKQQSILSQARISNEEGIYGTHLFTGLHFLF